MKSLCCVVVFMDYFIVILNIPAWSACTSYHSMVQKCRECWCGEAGY